MWQLPQVIAPVLKFARRARFLKKLTELTYLPFFQQAMISSTLGSWPICSPQNLLSERNEAVSSSPSSRTSNFAPRAHRNDCNGVSFAASSKCFDSLPNSLTIVGHLHRFGNRGRPLRSSSSASHKSLQGVQRALLDGHCRSSRSQGNPHLFGTGLRGLTFCGTNCKGVLKRDCNKAVLIRSNQVDDVGENEYCDRPRDQPHGACSFRRSSSPVTREGNNYVEVPEGSDPDQSGYTIKVSKELMGVFRYVEKVKRARIKELADTLKQTAGACMFFSCVRGIVGPLVEVFQTRPPSWGRLILMLSAFDSFAITYLALKASEPLEKLSMLASESDKDIMGSIEKEEEHMLALAVELVKLFRRLRNVTVCTAVAQFATLVLTLLQVNKPKLVANVAKVVAAWLHTPWNG